MLTSCEFGRFLRTPACTLLCAVKAVYGEKLIAVEGPPGEDGTAPKIEYRVWNPFRSKLAAAVLGGVDNIFIVPGAKVGRRGGLMLC